MNIKDNLILGKTGENFAVDYLISKNYKIITRNFHSQYGEIDIIALKQDCLVFIEVKTRSSSVESALSSVSRSKQKKLFKTAQSFILLHQEFEDYFTRFDVIAVIPYKESNHFHLEHLEEAFTPLY